MLHIACRLLPGYLRLEANLLTAGFQPLYIVVFRIAENVDELVGMRDTVDRLSGISTTVDELSNMTRKLPFWKAMTSRRATRRPRRSPQGGADDDPESDSSRS
jgi:hypothetical protein